MPRTRSRPEGTTFPAYSGRFLVDSFRGQMRARKWPRKRGRPKSELVREQNAWFRAVTQLVKFADAGQVIAAMAATKGTAVYPRDLLMHTISEGIMDITEVDGTFVQHRRPRVEGVAFQGARVQRLTNFNVVADVRVSIPWDLAILDTAAIWDIVNPTRLTVPVGVTVVRMEAAAIALTPGDGHLISVVNNSTTGDMGQIRTEISGPDANTMSTGPIPVVAGQFFEYDVICNASRPIAGGNQTFLSMEILGTT